MMGHHWGRGDDKWGAIGLPSGPYAWVMLAVGVVLMVPRVRAWLYGLSRVRFLGLVGAASFVLSLGYVELYLRGGPRIIDATTYYLQAKALSLGKLTWSVPEPAESFRGRFLVAPTEGTLTGIFPVGYPAILALGFLVRAPMLVGPAIACLLTLATYRLTQTMARTIEAKDDRAARTAALLALASGFRGP